LYFPSAAKQISLSILDQSALIEPLSGMPREILITLRNMTGY
jgi:hypothetical protein